MNIPLSQYTDILFCENLERYMEGEGGWGHKSSNYHVYTMTNWVFFQGLQQAIMVSDCVCFENCCVHSLLPCFHIVSVVRFLCLPQVLASLTAIPFLL